MSRLEWYKVTTIEIVPQVFLGDIDTVICRLEKIRDTLKKRGFSIVDITLEDTDPYSYSLWAAKEV